MASKPALAASLAASGLCAAMATAGRCTSILARSAAALFGFGVMGRGSPHRSGDIAAVDGGDVGGCLQRQRLVQECLRDVVGGDFAAEQVAAHVVLLGYTAGFGALFDEIRGQQSGAD